ncbi:glycoside hydrolase family 30 protein [Mucilaginibacter robiniae]|uniref:Glycoside hydrolase family 30 protein n=1 Tax=Mucilaginibacter robiniae TaxID=2728022 RepID=A0A7L5DXM3_9SPHI|nr:glycoside hydrolase family 30 protein [Mucilaginibacter robiniae]QJD95511.1 glycoside hydrolase family 30 protein [Mucilaginibacter robiniae]
MKKTPLLFKISALCVAFAYTAQAQQPVTSKFSTAGKKVTVYTTAENTNYRLAKTETVNFTTNEQPKESEACIFVDPAKTFQTVLGIGGALTDASAETFYKLPKAKQQEILTNYYDPKNGIGYTLGRTHIQSCDFSSDSYSYVINNDVDLKSFDIGHDKKYRIPFIKQIIAAAGGKLTMFATPWSPPAWMKTNNDVLHGGSLKAEYDQPWANFYVKFIKAYEKEGIPIWGLSVQNEPMANQTWESCIYTAAEERDFVKNFLGPTLHKSGMADKKLIIWDHNRDLLYQRASTVLEDPEAAKYVWGTGFHWYVHDVFDNVKRVKEAFPDKNLIFTEGCSERFNMSTIHEWKWGELYGKSMINDFNNGVVGWTDWNILLDEKGGPNHVGNFCFAPVHADTKTGEIIYMNAFYYIGHFSKFVRPMAKRVISSSNRDALQTTAFINQDGKLAVVVMNGTDQNLPYQLIIKGKSAATVSLPHSIATLVVD